MKLYIYHRETGILAAIIEAPTQDACFREADIITGGDLQSYRLSYVEPFPEEMPTVGSVQEITVNS